MDASVANWQRLPAEWVSRAFEGTGCILLHSGQASSTQHQSLLFTGPVRLIQTEDPKLLAACFADIEGALAEGHHVAGYITYEAGAALQAGCAHPLRTGAPLLCFGVYREPERFDHLRAAQRERSDSPNSEPPLEFALMPGVPYEHYESSLAALHQWIAAGDTYQVNYTIPFRSETTETPRRIYEALQHQQRASYAAVVRLLADDKSAPEILSFSPELFFQTDAHRTILTRPMKGTAPRGTDTTEDATQAAWLAADAKNRAEHVMIVDLLRNDLGRVCETGSVVADNLFHVETHPTVHQMTSDVRGVLRENTSWLDIFRALFPSGSITGAPKRRTMQIIHQVENSPRGVYTGAIGYIAPDGSSAFSVAIRTLELQAYAGAPITATLGVGGGIVADSTAPAEYAECLLKSSFVRRASKPLRLIETLRADGQHLRFMEKHFARLSRSAHELGIPCNLQEIEQKLRSYLVQHLSAEPQRVRLTLETSGELNVSHDLLQPWPAELRVRLARARTRLGDPALRHKTNYRPNYDEEFLQAKSAGFSESMFANDAGLLTEGCVTNVFVLRDGRLVTPYLECGVLPGVLRQEVLHRGLADESIVPLAELEQCEALLLGNSLRGFYPVSSLELTPGSTLSFDGKRSADFVRHLQSVLPEPPKP